MEGEKEVSNRLYKSRDQKVLDGVCGGLAEYFDVDAVLIRVLWVLISIFAGAGIMGIFAYLIAMIIMPSRPVGESPPKKYKANQYGELIPDAEDKASELEDDSSEKHHAGYNDYDQEVFKNRKQLSTWLGVALVAIGGVLLLERFLDISLRWWFHAYSAYLWPIALVILGIFLLTRRNSSDE